MAEEQVAKPRAKLPEDRAWQLQLRRDHIDMNMRVTALHNFMRSDDFPNVDKDEQARILRQSKSMAEALVIMEERIAAFVPRIPE